MSRISMLDNWTKSECELHEGTVKLTKDNELMFIITCCKCGNEFETNIFDVEPICDCGFKSNVKVVKYEI